MNSKEYNYLVSIITKLDTKKLYELHALVSREKNKRIYDDFKQKMLYNNPRQLEDYINNYLNIPICKDNYKENIHLLIRLLGDKGKYVDKQFIIGYVRDIKQDIELNNAFKLRDLEKRSDYLTINDMGYMNGHEFEYFLEFLFEKMGHTVIKITKHTRDQGADLITIKSGEVNVIQAKKYKIGNNIGNDTIRDVVAAIKHYSAHNGIIVTTSNFTIDAVKLARSNGVELINGYQLYKLINIYVA
jgi:hypothetical protein